ncbi:MAG: VOC family protein [Myxococcales bacterium]|nr:VOC family protein [Myxococcales bacterium]MDD9970926.1 VOC family protein [Myxococcales bacterium]
MNAAHSVVAPAVAKVRHLDHINMTVRDLEASLQFYRDLFGFEKVESGELPSGPWAIVRSGDAMLCLYEHANVPEGPRYPAAPAEQGVRHFGLRIHNGPAFHALLEQKGVPLMYGGPVEWPHSIAYYVADPTGHQIEVVCWHNDTIAFEA